MEYSSQEPLLGIGAFAKRVGLSVSAIRKYEDEGLIIPHRTGSGHRMFSCEDIRRIETIQHLLKKLGFNIEGIRRTQAFLPCWELLPCKESEKYSCAAFSNVSQPCWLIKDAHCSKQGNKCRECNVYRFGSLCTEHVKPLLHNKNKGVDSKTLMVRLVEKYLNNT